MKYRGKGHRGHYRRYRICHRKSNTSYIHDSTEDKSNHGIPLLSKHKTMNSTEPTDDGYESLHVSFSCDDLPKEFIHPGESKVLDDNLFESLKKEANIEEETPQESCEEVVSKDLIGKSGDSKEIRDPCDENNELGLVESFSSRNLAIASGTMEPDILYEIEVFRIGGIADWNTLERKLNKSNYFKNISVAWQTTNKTCKLAGLRRDVVRAKTWLDKTFMCESNSAIGTVCKHGNSTVQEFVQRPRCTREASGSKYLPSWRKGGTVKKKVNLGKLEYVSPFSSAKHFTMKNFCSEEDCDMIEFFSEALTVCVRFGIITNQRSQRHVVVNSYDHGTTMDDALSDQIIQDAGFKVEKEFRKTRESMYFKDHGILRAGQMFHTSAGRLCASIKYLLHVVAPVSTKSSFSESNASSKSIEPKPSISLRDIFYNCFEYTDDLTAQPSVYLQLVQVGVVYVY